MNNSFLKEGFFKIIDVYIKNKRVFVIILIYFTRFLKKKVLRNFHILPTLNDVPNYMKIFITVKTLKEAFKKFPWTKRSVNFALAT